MAWQLDDTGSASWVDDPQQSQGTGGPFGMGMQQGYDPSSDSFSMVDRAPDFRNQPWFQDVLKQQAQYGTAGLGDMMKAGQYSIPQGQGNQDYFNNWLNTQQYQESGGDNPMKDPIFLSALMAVTGGAAGAAAGGAGLSAMGSSMAGGAAAGGTQAAGNSEGLGGILKGAAVGAGMAGAGSYTGSMFSPEVANSGADFGGQGVGWNPNQMGSMGAEGAQSFPVGDPQQGMTSSPLQQQNINPIGSPQEMLQQGLGTQQPQQSTQIAQASPTDGGLGPMAQGPATTPDWSKVDFNNIFSGLDQTNGFTNQGSAPAPDMSGIPTTTGGNQLPGLGQMAAGATGLGGAYATEGGAMDQNGSNTMQTNSVTGGQTNDTIFGGNGSNPMPGTPNTGQGTGTGLNGLLSVLGLGGGTGSGGTGQQGGMNIPGMIGSGMEFAGAQQYRSQLMNLMQQAVDKSDPFASQRGQYQQQFQQYNTDPNFFQNDSVMQGLQNNALRNVESRDATKGYLGSGNMLMDSIRQSNETAAPYMLARGNQLMQAAGGNSNPAAAGQAMQSLSPLIAGAGNQSMGALGSLMQYGLGAQTGANGAPQGGMNLSGIGNMVTNGINGIKNIFGE